MDDAPVGLKQKVFRDISFHMFLIGSVLILAMVSLPAINTAHYQNAVKGNILSTILFGFVIAMRWAIGKFQKKYPVYNPYQLSEKG